MSQFAWVTLATNDSYSLGALVVANSLKKVATKHQLAVLITPGVTESMRTKLGAVFDLVQEVNVLDSKDAANLSLLARPELGVTFTKLHCWRLTQYTKCVFVDADTLILQNADELFEREELSAAPDVGWPDCFNSGVFVYKPSQETFEKLIAFAVQKGSFDGGDQGLLNLFFSDWSTKDISRHLPFVYNTCSTACYSYLPAFKQFGEGVKILHFIGQLKPWLINFDSATRTAVTPNGFGHLATYLQLWWDIFCNEIHPKLSADMNRQDQRQIGNTPRWYENPQFQYVPPKDHASGGVEDNLRSGTDSDKPSEHEQYDPWEEYYEEKQRKVSENEPVDRLSQKEQKEYKEAEEQLRNLVKLYQANEQKPQQKQPETQNHKRHHRQHHHQEHLHQGHHHKEHHHHPEHHQQHFEHHHQTQEHHHQPQEQHHHEHHPQDHHHKKPQHEEHQHHDEPHHPKHHHHEDHHHQKHHHHQEHQQHKQHHQHQEHHHNKHDHHHYEHQHQRHEEHQHHQNHRHEEQQQHHQHHHHEEHKHHHEEYQHHHHEEHHHHEGHQHHEEHQQPHLDDQQHHQQHHHHHQEHHHQQHQLQEPQPQPPHLAHLRQQPIIGRPIESPKVHRTDPIHKGHHPSHEPHHTHDRTQSAQQIYRQHQFQTQAQPRTKSPTPQPTTPQPKPHSRFQYQQPHRHIPHSSTHSYRPKPKRINPSQYSASMPHQRPASAESDESTSPGRKSADADDARPADRPPTDPVGKNSLESGIAGALAQLTLGAPRSTEQSAFEESMRQQFWESGNIDYMGKDSFDNIWKRITQTLSANSSDASASATSSAAAPSASSSEGATKKEGPHYRFKKADQNSVQKHTDKKSATAVTKQQTQQTSKQSSTTVSTSERRSSITQSTQQVSTAERRSSVTQESTKESSKTQTQVQKSGIDTNQTIVIVPGHQKVEFDAATNTKTVTERTTTGHQQTITTVTPEGITKTQIKTFFDPVEVAAEETIEEEEEIYEETHTTEPSTKTTTTKTTTGASNLVSQLKEDKTLQTIKKQEETNQVQVAKSLPENTVTTKVLGEEDVRYETIVSEDGKTTITRKIVTQPAEEIEIIEYEEHEVTEEETTVSKTDNKKRKTRSVAAKENTVVSEDGRKVTSKSVNKKGEEIETIEYEEEHIEEPVSKPKTVTKTTTIPAKDLRNKQTVDQSVNQKTSTSTTEVQEVQKSSQKINKERQDTSQTLVRREDNTQIAGLPTKAVVRNTLPDGQEVEVESAVSEDGKTKILKKTVRQPEEEIEVEDYEETSTVVPKKRTTTKNSNVVAVVQDDEEQENTIKSDKTKTTKNKVASETILVSAETDKAIGQHQEVAESTDTTNVKGLATTKVNDGRLTTSVDATTTNTKTLDKEENTVVGNTKKSSKSSATSTKTTTISSSQSAPMQRLQHDSLTDTNLAAIEKNTEIMKTDKTVTAAITDTNVEKKQRNQITNKNTTEEQQIQQKLTTNKKTTEDQQTQQKQTTKQNTSSTVDESTSTTTTTTTLTKQQQVQKTQLLSQLGLTTADKQYTTTVANTTTDAKTGDVTTEEVRRFNEGTEHIYTTVCKDGSLRVNSKTFFNTVPVTAGDKKEVQEQQQKQIAKNTTSSATDGGSTTTTTTTTTTTLTKQQQAQKSQMLSQLGLTTADKKFTSSVVNTTTDAKTGDVTTEEVRRFAGGTEHIYTTVCKDGTLRMNSKTFFDSVPVEGSEQHFEEDEEYEEITTTTSSGGDRNVDDLSKKKLRPAASSKETADHTPSPIPPPRKKEVKQVTQQKAPIIDTNPPDVLVPGRRFVEMDEATNTTTVTERTENGYKQIIRTVTPEGVIRTQTKTFFNPVETEAEESVEEEEEVYVEVETIEPTTRTTSTKVVRTASDQFAEQVDDENVFQSATTNSNVQIVSRKPTTTTVNKKVLGEQNVHFETVLSEDGKTTITRKIVTTPAEEIEIIEYEVVEITEPREVKILNSTRTVSAKRQDSRSSTVSDELVISSENLNQSVEVEIVEVDLEQLERGVTVSDTIPLVTSSNNSSANLSNTSSKSDLQDTKHSSKKMNTKKKNASKTTLCRVEDNEIAIPPKAIAKHTLFDGQEVEVETALSKNGKVKILKKTVRQPQEDIEVDDYEETSSVVPKMHNKSQDGLQVARTNDVLENSIKTQKSRASKNQTASETILVSTDSERPIGQHRELEITSDTTTEQGLATTKLDGDQLMTNVTAISSNTKTLDQFSNTVVGNTKKTSQSSVTSTKTTTISTSQSSSSGQRRLQRDSLTETNLAALQHNKEQI